MPKSIFIILLCLLEPLLQMQTCFAQESSGYQIRTVAFYNLENLFDTVNDSLTFDDDRTPEGKDRWSDKRYREKIEKLSGVLSEIGREVASSSPDLIGVCEAENRRVLADLVQHNNLKAANYGILHFDSPDERGIDVALLYKRAVFSPTAFQSHRLLLLDEEGERDYTRDPLVVSGLLDGELLHLLVNHWPSRSGGEARSAPFRKAAAELNLRIIDSLAREAPAPGIILMGDLNDNPTDHSLKKILKAKGEISLIGAGELYNPMESLYKKGAGSLAYRDTWSLFDQILLSASLVFPVRGNYRFWRAGIHNPPRLLTKSGRYRGYPYRSYAGGRYSGGYSDHFPVYLYLIREAP
jgi:hypothetical protein